MKVNRSEIWNKFGGRCAYCGIELEKNKFHIDHIDPHWHNLTEEEAKKIKVKKGTHEIKNLNPSCPRCNRWKSTWTIEQFREEIRLQIERLNKYSSSYRMAKDYGLVVEPKVDVKFYFERCGEN